MTVKSTFLFRIILYRLRYLTIRTYYKSKKSQMQAGSWTLGFYNSSYSPVSIFLITFVF